MNYATTTKDNREVDRGQLTVDRRKDKYERVRYPYLLKCNKSKEGLAQT
jgi:hypothetical protein